MKKNYLKIVLDLLMALAFALLMNPRVLNGLPFHEIAGLVFGVVILTHIGLNLQWVKNTTLKIFDSKLPNKTRFSYLLNILLLITMSTIIITGILISRVVFPNLAIEGNRLIRGLHSLSANITLALVGLHIGVHWQWIMSVSKKMFKSTEGKPRRGVIALALFALIILAGGMQLYSSTSSSNAVAFHSNSIQQRNFDQGFNNENNRNDNKTQISYGEASILQGPQNVDFRERHGRGAAGHGGSTNSLLVILNYFVIFAALIVPTYYLEKRILRKKLGQKTSKLPIKDE